MQAGGEKVFTSSWDCMLQIIQTHGVVALWAGALTGCVWKLLDNTILLLYEILKAQIADRMRKKSQ